MIKFSAAALALVVALPAAAVTVTYGAGSDYAGTTLTETFDGATAGNFTQSFTDTIGGVDFAYTDVNVGDYGYGNGTNYAGSYVGVGFASPGSFTLGFEGAQRYFGLLITSSDPTNALTFYSGETAVFSYAVGSNFSGSSFVNFAFGSQSFDSVVFTAGPGTGFESDNHTIAAVPEPATWALMIGGFGLVGGTLRRRRAVPA